MCVCASLKKKIVVFACFYYPDIFEDRQWSVLTAKQCVVSAVRIMFCPASLFIKPFVHLHSTAVNFPNEQLMVVIILLACA